MEDNNQKNHRAALVIDGLLVAVLAGIGLALVNQILDLNKVALKSPGEVLQEKRYDFVRYSDSLLFQQLQDSVVCLEGVVFTVKGKITQLRIEAQNEQVQINEARGKGELLADTLKVYFSKTAELRDSVDATIAEVKRLAAFAADTSASGPIGHSSKCAEVLKKLAQKETELESQYSLDTVQSK